MIERGHDVRLLCPPEARISQEAARFGVPVETLPIGRKNLRGLLAMRRYLAATHFDVVNTHSSTDTWLAALACQSLGDAPPIVRTRHISAPVSANWGSRWLYGKANRHIVTTGESLRRQLIDVNGFSPAMITSVPTGIDTQRFSPGDKMAARLSLGLEPACRYIGIVATLRSWKGHLYLLEAFASMRLSGWKMLIVGDGPMLRPIEEKIAELGLGDQVVLAGQQNHPETWMQAMDIFCLPSYANEGVPQAVLQAMLCALPIVSTPVGAITEAIQDGVTGLIVAPKNASAIAAGIQRLVADPALCDRLGSEARRLAERQFSREAMLDKMAAIFSAAKGRP